jgi:hypothetical protein
MSPPVADRAITVIGRSANGNAVWWFVLFALCCVLLAPLSIADVPPLLDYLNHLARLYALAFVPDDPILARFFALRWGIIPNLALDLTVPPLLRIFPVHDVGRVVAGVILLLPVFGAVAYHRALNGRLSYWPLASVLFVYNASSLRGFLNFVSSVGLALLLAAVWVAWRDTRPRLAILSAAVGAVALFFCHLTGLLFFAILIGGNELVWLRTMRFGGAEMWRRIAAVIVVFTAPLLLYAVSHLGGMQSDPDFRSLTGKAFAALYPVINYYWPLDLLTAAVCVMVPAVCLVKRWCTMQLRAAVAVVVLLILFLVAPVAFKGTNDLDTRFIIMAAFAIPAAIKPIALPNRAAWTIGCLFLLLFAARMTVLVLAWQNWAGELSAFRTVIAPVQPGDVVMTVKTPARPEPYLWTSAAPGGSLSDGTIVDMHLPGLLVIEHDAFWPFLFDNLSQQPILKREPYRAAAEMTDGSADPIALPASRPPEMRPFTHVLMIGANPANIDTTGLRLVRANDVAALFAVVR